MWRERGVGRGELKKGASVVLEYVLENTKVSEACLDALETLISVAARRAMIILTEARSFFLTRDKTHRFIASYCTLIRIGARHCFVSITADTHEQRVPKTPLFDQPLSCLIPGTTDPRPEIFGRLRNCNC